MSQAGHENLFIIDRMCDLAAIEIDGIIASIIEEGVAEVMDHASALGLDDFDSEIKVVSMDNDVYITTHSGILNFSTPQKEMLPSLLKSAEISPTTGNKNKKIPIQKKRKRKVRSLMDALKNRAEEKGLNYSGPHTSPESNASSSIANAVNNFKNQTVEEKEGPVEFRTASSKQDPNRSWVIPPKEADMTLIIESVNRRISMEIDQAISDTINRYEEEAWHSF
jgi:hypothetical protein